MTTVSTAAAAQAALLALKHELTVHTDLGEHLLLDTTSQLVDQWLAALATGCERTLIDDVDTLFVRLETFKVKARRALPITNGGFQGYEPDDWRRLLVEHSITIFREGDDWTFTGAESESFDDKNDALNAALQAHPEIVHRFLETALPRADSNNANVDRPLKSDPLHARVFRPDGRLRGVSYCKPSTLRGAVLTVKPTVSLSGVTGKVNTYMLDNHDYHAQYARGVRYIADHHGISADSPLFAAMLSTASMFLNHYRLSLRDVAFKTAFQLG